MKIRPVGAELFHEDGRTDKSKLTVAFHNFVNSPQKMKEMGWPCRRWLQIQIACDTANHTTDHHKENGALLGLLRGE